MSPAVAVSLYYFLIFGGIGIFWPHYGPFLKDSLGMSAAQASAVYSIGPLMGLMMPAIVGLLADAFRARVWALRVLTAGAAVVFALWLTLPRAAVVIFGIAILYGFCRAPLTALIDASAFEAARHGSWTYGRIRVWGSVGFLLAAFLGGVLLEHVGVRAMLITTVAGIALAAVCAWYVPAPPPAANPHVFRAWKQMLREQDLWIYLFACAAHYAASAALDSCFSLYLRDLGHGGTFIGAAWTVGVLAEVGFFWGASRMTARWGADRVLMFALAVGVVRWAALAFVRSPEGIMLLQPLHGITFGCFWVAGTQIARERAPAEAQTAAQGLFGAASSLGAFTAQLVAGAVYQARGPRTLFLAAAVLSAIAACAAAVYVTVSRREAPATA